MKPMLFSILFMLASSVASADCWYNGYDYPPGTLIAGFSCQIDGTWDSI